jgi:hypothetical protein
VRSRTLATTATTVIITRLKEAVATIAVALDKEAVEVEEAEAAAAAAAAIITTARLH